MLLIGYGNMGKAIHSRWQQTGLKHDIAISSRKAPIEQGRGFFDLVILATKPNDIEIALKQHEKFIANDALIISLAAGVTIEQIRSYIAKPAHIVRVMPNTPAQIGQGVSVCYSNSQKLVEVQVEELLTALGEVYWINDEKQMHIVTALSGSGPAYILKIAEIIIECGVGQGLDAELTRNIVLSTISGTVKLAEESRLPLAELRGSVTSKGGTTEAALSVLNDNNALGNLLTQAILKATTRSAELNSLK